MSKFTVENSSLFSENSRFLADRQTLLQTIECSEITKQDTDKPKTSPNSLENLHYSAFLFIAKILF